MAPTTDTAADTAAEAAAPAAGTIKRYPVKQGNGDVRHQLILVTGPGEDGAVHGLPLCYEDQLAHFRPGDFAGD